LLPAVALIAGCSSPAPPTTAVADAKSVVETALNAWRNSEQIQSLREAKDSILVADPRWESGWKLDAFEFVEQNPDGYQVRCKVKLSLKDPSGNSSRETAEYLATSAPKKSVTRSSEGW
jgi:hypothetical protein